MESELERARTYDTVNRESLLPPEEPEVVEPSAPPQIQEQFEPVEPAS
jgi:hypothetical protein